MKRKISFALVAVSIVIISIIVYSFYNKDGRVFTYYVGRDGGEISTEDNGIRLVIPAQAVEGKTGISISADNSKGLMGPNQVSDLYTVAGLHNFYKPVTVQIKTTAPLAGETYVALGRSAYVKSMGEWTTGFEYLPCTIKEDTVEFVLKPAIIEPSSGMISRWSPFTPKAAYAADGPISGEETSFQAVVITNQQSTLSSDKKFNLIASVEITPEERHLIMDYLEYCYQFFAGMGFNQSFEKRAGLELLGETPAEPPSWPLDVHIKDFWFWEKQVAGYWVRNNDNTDGWIEINPLVMRGSDNEIWSSIIHEYFHFVQFLYGSENEWFDEATATWAEEYGYRKGEERFNPGNYRKNGTERFQVLDGPINHSGRSDRDHGYGSWAFVKFLVRTPAQGGELVKVYDNITSYKSEVQILNAIRPVREWINQFYLTLLTPEGPIPGFPPAAFRNAEANTPVVTVSLADAGQVPPQRQMVTVPGLGARVVLVRLDAANANNITDSTSLEVRSNSDDCTVNLVRTTKFEILATGKNAASTVKVATLSRDSWPQQVLVLVTNTSEQTITCNLDITVKAAKEFEVWLFQHKFQDRTGGWLGPQVLLYRNEQGQYYKMEMDRRHTTGPKYEYGLKIEGDRVTIIDYIQPESTIYDIYEGAFSADRKSIVGTGVTRKKADNSLFNRYVYDFRMTQVEE
jgi:hypothetical protein